MQAFLDRFPRPVLIVDGGLRVVACSRRVFPLFGLRAGPEPDEGPDRLERILSEEQELGDPLALATARLVQPGDEERFTWRHRSRTYSVCVSAMEEDRFLVLFEDITALAFSEDVLVNARRYLEQVLDDIPLGVVVLNQELRITSINRQELRFLEQMGVGIGLVDAIGATLEEVASGEAGAEWHRICRAVLESGRRHRAPGRSHPTGEGEELVLAVEATPLRDARGRTCGVILMFDDVTEQARLEKELIRVEKLATVGQMVITINHEINNPLSIISTNAQSLRLLNPDLDEKIVGKLRKIEEQVKRISEVTDRLRKMDEVATSEYIDSGPRMIDVWKGEREEG